MSFWLSILGTKLNIIGLEDNDISGNVLFVQEEINAPLKITGEVKGLSPGPHGFQVHKNSDPSNANTCESAGQPFNPTESWEDWREGSPAHTWDDKSTLISSGDLGGIDATADGIATINITIDSGLSCLFGMYLSLIHI